MILKDMQIRENVLFGTLKRGDNLIFPSRLSADKFLSIRVHVFYGAEKE